MSSYISRIISMRDADHRRTKPSVGSKEYAIAWPVINDDTESDHADDEYESGDEFLIISSDSEHCNSQNAQSEVGSSISDDGSSGLNISEDYFDSLLSPSYQEFHDLDLETGEFQEDGPPAIRLNLAMQLSSPAEEDASITTPQDTEAVDGYTSLELEEGVDLQEDTFGSQQEYDVDDVDMSDSWSLASVCYDDSWAFEIEFAEEEEYAAREEEDMAATIIGRQSSSSAIHSFYNLPRTLDRRDLEADFCLRPDVLGGLPRGRRAVFPRQRC